MYDQLLNVSSDISILPFHIHRENAHGMTKSAKIFLRQGALRDVIGDYHSSVVNVLLLLVVQR
jgi:hypothetical protein